MKYGRHQPLGEFELAPVLLREVQQLVRLHGVGVLEQVEAVLEARVGRDAGHALEHLLRLVGGDALVLREVVDLAALEVDRGVGRRARTSGTSTSTAGASSSGCLGEPVLEVALADVAPGAGDVGPHVDLDGIRHVRHNRAVASEATYSPAASVTSAGSSGVSTAPPKRRSRSR